MVLTSMHWVVAALVLLLMFLIRRYELSQRMLQVRANEQAARFQAVFEAAGLGVLLIDGNCRVDEANGSAEALLGWSRRDLVGQKLCSEIVAPAEDGGPTCACLCAVGQNPARPQEEALVPLRLRRRDGSSLPVLASVAPLHTGRPGDGFALLMWDVSERLRLEEENRMRRRQAEGLHAIGREIAAMSGLKHGMNAILNRARDLFGMDLIVWGILDDASDTITWHAAQGVGADRFRNRTIGLEHMVMGRVLRAGRTFVSHNLAGQCGAEPLFRDPCWQSAMAVPLRVRESAHGVLLCASLSPLDLTDQDVMFFTHLASYLATAVENDELLEQLQHMATLEERQRLAREMHDSLGQTLTYLGMRLHMIGKMADKGEGQKVAAEAANLRKLLQEAHTEVRSTIFQLKESGAPQAPLVDRWRQLLDEFEGRGGLAIRFEHPEGLDLRLPEQVHMQLTRIVQEALANVRNHAGAREATVRLEVAEASLQVHISDNGCGFDLPDAAGPAQHHFGLSIMRERAAAVGADLKIRSMRGHGTTVSIRWPLRGREG
jgi:PAS domain S-box-containing protein